MNYGNASKKTPLQRNISGPLENLMRSDQCLNEIKEEIIEMEQAIEKLRERCKHWDQVYQQCHINNYHYIDSHGILHENMTYFVDGEGTTHETPLQYMAEYGTAYPTLDYESQTVEADDQHKCYQSFSPRRRIPKIQHAQKYLSKKKQAYKTAAISADEQGDDITNEQEII
jgi:hypothetical protein